MNKKEVLEIRKQFTPENCAITRIARLLRGWRKRETHGKRRSVSFTAGRTGV